MVFVGFHGLNDTFELKVFMVSCDVNIKQAGSMRDACMTQGLALSILSNASRWHHNGYRLALRSCHR